METTKYLPIDDQHQAGIQADGNRIIIWIEKKKKYWLWIDFVRCSWVVLYELGNEDRVGGCSLRGMWLNHCMTLDINHRNINGFDFKKEVMILFKSYMQTVKDRISIENKIDKLINSI